MQELEIEKRFLVPEKKIEELMGMAIADSKKMMNDVYVPNGDAHKNLRLRQKNDEFVIIYKIIQIFIILKFEFQHCETSMSSTKNI